MDSIPFGTEEFRLVRAGPRDKEYILRCMKETILCSVPKDVGDYRHLWMDDIMTVVSANLEGGRMDSEAFVLVSDEGNAGALWMGRSKDQFTCDDTGYLLGLFVERRYRRKGLGTELLRAAERWCSANGLLSMTLNVGSVNDAAVKLYTKAGYDSQSIVMKKDLK